VKSVPTCVFSHTFVLTTPFQLLRLSPLRVSPGRNPCRQRRGTRHKSGDRAGRRRAGDTGRHSQWAALLSAVSDTRRHLPANIAHDQYSGSCYSVTRCCVVLHTLQSLFSVFMCSDCSSHTQRRFGITIM
jgi:hypothetical protein